MGQSLTKVIQGTLSPLQVKEINAPQKGLHEEQLNKTGAQMELQACSLLLVAGGMHESVPENTGGEEGISPLRKLGQKAANPLGGEGSCPSVR